ncbi:alpha/beta-hydrolase [Clavulina sp. PMI_390]|nr:alpha/beta-hydrolase [Clavulina sp. PMI_390]
MISVTALALLVSPLLGSVGAHALPPTERSNSVSPMTATEESAYTPYALFARAAYCPAAETGTWSCGASCSAIPNFNTYGSGGYVGYDPTFFNAVVVAHQGISATNILSDITDADFFLTPLDSRLFPGLAPGIEVHNGFQNVHANTATTLLAAVQNAMAATGSTHIVLTGHSIGAAVALLDAVYLPLHLPSATTFSTAVFGLPRVGNTAFASYVDGHTTNFAHITNKHDPVPTLPGRFLGFTHPSNEKHIVTTGLKDGNWYACAGQDNTNRDCSTGAVPNLFSGNEADHNGPYGDIEMGSC